jgi:DnaK suppressor protein
MSGSCPPLKRGFLNRKPALSGVIQNSTTIHNVKIRRVDAERWGARCFPPRIAAAAQGGRDFLQESCGARRFIAIVAAKDQCTRMLDPPRHLPNREASERAVRVEGVMMRQGHIERRLRHELDTIIGRLDHAGALAASDELSGELVDDAQVVEIREDHQSSRARLVLRAKGLVDALQRLRVGTYGRCDECEDSIPTARLRALPSATTCVRCQVRREETRVMARR